MLSRRDKSTQSILNHGLRVALVWVCLSVALGNSLVALLLNVQSTLACPSLPTEEKPIEEAPEAELPVELIELDEFTLQLTNDWQRRRRAGTLRTIFYADTCRCRQACGAINLATGTSMRHRNGCGAALRC